VPPLTALRLTFTGVFILVFAYTAIESRTFPSISGMYPFVISLFGLGLAAVSFALDVRTWRRKGDVVGADADNSATAALVADGSATVGQAFRRAGRYALWLLGLAVLAYLIGMVAAAGVFLAAFLWIEARAKWPLLIAGPAITMGLLMLLADALNLYWPDALFELIA
jgi:hypothetical protein